MAYNFTNIAKMKTNYDYLNNEPSVENGVPINTWMTKMVFGGDENDLQGKEFNGIESGAFSYSEFKMTRSAAGSIKSSKSTNSLDGE